MDQRRVGAEHVAVGRRLVDALRRVLVDLPVLALGLGQRRLGVALLGHVFDRADIAEHAPLGAAQDGRALRRPDRLTVAPKGSADPGNDTAVALQFCVDPVAVVGIGVHVGDMRHFGDHLCRVVVAVDPRHRRVGAQDSPVGRVLEHADTGVRQRQFERFGVPRLGRVARAGRRRRCHGPLFSCHSGPGWSLSGAMMPCATPGRNQGF